MIRTKKKTKAFSSDFLKLLFIFLLIISLVIFSIERFISKHSKDSQLTSGGNDPEMYQRERIYLAIDDVLNRNNIQYDWITQDGAKKTIRIPKQIPLIKICKEVVSNVQEYGGQILKSYEEIRTGEIVLEIGYKNKIIQNLRFKHDAQLKPQVGTIAIIIDDFGYALTDVVQNFLELEYPIAISIIPGLKKSQQIAEAALLNHKQIMIHLPMESQAEKTFDNGYAIYTYMSDAEIHQRVEAAIRSLSNAKGLNNHQGSKVTVNRRTISAVLEILQKHKIYFVDSQTANSSLAFETAQQMGIPSAKRDVFLDNNDEPDYIRKQIRRLAGIASRNSCAVGIGHVRANTYTTLIEELPRLAKLGYRIVPVSEIMQ